MAEGVIVARVNEPNVWGRLYDDDAIDKAVAVLAASVGVDQNPLVLIDELETVCDWIWEPSDQSKVVERVVHVAAALTTLCRIGVQQLAYMAEQAKLSTDEYLEPDEDDVRNSTLYLVDQYADQLRRMARGEPEAE